MKRLIILIWLFISLSAASQEPLINRYEYWFNNQLETRTQAVITPVKDASLQMDIIVKDLPVGLNTLNFRFGDKDGHWSVPLRRYFLIIPPVLASGEQEKMITGFEYGVNHGEMTFVPVSGSNVLQLEEIKSIAHLPDGLNKLNYRFLDNSGLWSPLSGHFFVKVPANKSINDAGRKIVAYQYRFNSGELNTVNVESTADFSIDAAFNVAPLPDGLNSVHIRFLDNTGAWSPILSKFFIKHPFAGVDGSFITTYQYWYNNDLSKMKQVDATPGESFLLIESFDGSHLTDGINMLTFRFSDNKGNWSVPSSRVVYKTPGRVIADPLQIVAWQYWVEDAQGNHFDAEGLSGINNVILAEAIDPLILELDIDVRMIPAGEYYLVVRFLDSKGNWSSSLSQEIEKFVLPHAAFTAVETEFCESGTVEFINRSVDADTFLWDFGDSNTSSVFAPTHFYSSAGNYSVSLTASLQGNPFQGYLSISDFVRVNALPGSDFTFQVNDNSVSFSIDGGNGSLYIWNFGDGATSDLEKPAHTYQGPGEYNVCLNVISKSGCRSETCKLIGITTGFDEISFSKSAIIHPVPFADNFVIGFNDDSIDYLVEIFTQNGQKQFGEKVFAGSKSVVIDGSGWQKGVYIIKVVSLSGTVQVFKTIKL